MVIDRGWDWGIGGYYSFAVIIGFPGSVLGGPPILENKFEDIYKDSTD